MTRTPLMHPTASALDAIEFEPRDLFLEVWSFEWCAMQHDMNVIAAHVDGIGAGDLLPPIHNLDPREVATLLTD